MDMPRLGLSVYAWSRLKFFERMAGRNEFGCFGISDDAAHPLSITDVWVPLQTVDSTETEFDDVGVNTELGRFLDLGYTSEQVMRVWIHTHPFSQGVPTPSDTDWDTFRRLFANSWGAMVILGQNDAVYGCLKIQTPLPGHVGLTVGVDWTLPFPEGKPDQWEVDFDKIVESKVTTIIPAHYMKVSKRQAKRFRRDTAMSKATAHIQVMRGEVIPDSERKLSHNYPFEPGSAADDAFEGGCTE